MTDQPAPPASRPGVSCVIQARNAAATIERALHSVAWVDECLVAVMPSDDDTGDVARRHGARVIEIPFHPRVDGVRNACVEQARCEWVLVLDADERLAADAGPALRQVIADKGQTYDAFRLPRINHIAGQVMRGSRWYPDYQTRLFRRGSVQWSDTHHDPPRVLRPGRVLSLEPPCPHVHHDSYRSIREFARRQAGYALSQRYDTNPSSFDFARCLAQAHQELALRNDRERDGDLAYALAQLMAWDAIVRGVLHWQALEPRPPFPGAEALAAASAGYRQPRARLHRWLVRRSPLSYRARRVVEWWERWRPGSQP